MAIAFVTDQITPVTKGFIKEVVCNWNVNHPTRQIHLRFLDHEELRDKLEEYLTQKTPPDVVTWFAGNRMRSFIERELMAKIDSINGIDNFIRALEPRFQAMFIEGESQYFIPTSYFWWAIYYNRSVFNRAGINFPIKNWNNLILAAEKLRMIGVTPFSLGSYYRCPVVAWFDYLNMRINGPDFHQQLMELSIPYTDERIRTVLSFFRELQDKNWFLGKPGFYDEEEAVKAVLTGKAGMVFIGSYIRDEYISPDYAEHLDFFRFPIINKGVAIGEDTPIDGFFASGRSKNLQEAGDFLLHLGSKDVQTLATKTITALPTRSDVVIGNSRSDLLKGREIIEQANNLFQFYDLDTPWEIADVGMDLINKFANYEIDEFAVQRRLEEARLNFLNLNGNNL